MILVDGKPIRTNDLIGDDFELFDELFGKIFMSKTFSRTRKSVKIDGIDSDGSRFIKRTRKLLPTAYDSWGNLNFSKLDSLSKVNFRRNSVLTTE
uniref:Uncharacterized protein n=1 Tax=Panagrolaimus sp. JU765 TaxID=591449 RepID=A0AC34Q855_9BILA